jgi:hypothetical protein
MATMRLSCLPRHRRGPSAVEYVLALSVIVGFAFVSVRIMNGGMPTSTVSRTEAIQTPDDGAAEVKTDAPEPTTP